MPFNRNKGRALRTANRLKELACGLPSGRGNDVPLKSVYLLVWRTQGRAAADRYWALTWKLGRTPHASYSAHINELVRIEESTWPIPEMEPLLRALGMVYRPNRGIIND